MGTNYYRVTGEHIGKKSCGWSFCFCDNYGFETFDDAVKWINSGDIVDEYGRTITNEDFWHMVENAQFDSHTPDSRWSPVRLLDNHDFMEGEFC
jgi:hypothetical protein